MPSMLYSGFGEPRSRNRLIVTFPNVFLLGTYNCCCLLLVLLRVCDMFCLALFRVYFTFISFYCLMGFCKLRIAAFFCILWLVFACEPHQSFFIYRLLKLLELVARCNKLWSRVFFYYCHWLRRLPYLKTVLAQALLLFASLYFLAFRWALLFQLFTPNQVWRLVWHD